MARVQVESHRMIVRDTNSHALINTDKNAYTIYMQRIKEARESSNDLRNAVRDINNLKQEMFDINKRIINKDGKIKWQQDQ